MPSFGADSRRRPTRVGMVAGALACAGIFLAVTVDMIFLVLAAFGTFGPGILRELGWLRDQDEFQRRAAHRAGYHAYLVGGFVAILVVALMQAGTANIDGGPAMVAALMLVVLWLTWFFSMFLDFWGPQRAASRTLIVFGSFWLMFVVLSHIKEPGSLFMESLVVLPFFVLAWLVGRWPRPAGALLLLVAVGTTVLFRIFKLHGVKPEDVLVKAIVFVLFEVPLVASGLALIRLRRDAEEIEA
jgi:hypothetical protein